MEREAIQQAIAPSATALQSKEKGKDVIETHGSGQPSQEMEVLQRGEAFKLGLAKLNAQLQTYVQEPEAEPKKKKNHLVCQQLEFLEALVAQTDQISQQVAMDQ